MPMASGFFFDFALGHGGDDGRAGDHGYESESYEKFMHAWLLETQKLKVGSTHAVKLSICANFAVTKRGCGCVTSLVLPIYTHWFRNQSKNGLNKGVLVARGWYALCPKSCMDRQGQGRIPGNVTLVT
jgi:hypothetical protein